MSPQTHRFPLSRKHLAGAAVAATLMPAAALADSKEATVVGLVPQQLVVDSNGSSYHAVSPFANLVADVRVQVDTGAVGRVKSWRVHLGLAGEEGASQFYDSYNVAKSYPWYDRPRSVDRTEQIIVPSAAWGGFVKTRCNALADELRSQGLGDTAIFAQDRKLQLAVVPSLAADTTGAGSGSIIEEATWWSQHAKIDLVCKKWPGAAVPQASSDITIQPAKVVNQGLTIVERSGLGGACKIRLDGWFTTDRKGASVSYRFETADGKKSEVQAANTGESKTASFSRWEDIANNPDGPETGKVRLVGVSHDFATGWVDYALNCVEGGPGNLVANDPPLLKMTAVPQGKVMVQGRICPEVVKLVGVLEGRGNFSGQALFYGTHYLSPLRDYSITHGQKLLIGAEAELNWDQAPAPLNAQAPLAQSRDFGLNVTDKNNKVIASLPKRTILIECQRPRVTPGVQLNPGGLTTESRDPQPAAPAATRRLKLQKPVEPTPPRRLQPAPLRPAN